MPQRVAGERARALRELVQEKERSHRDARAGTPAWVVVEGDGGTGLTGDYLRVSVEGVEAAAALPGARRAAVRGTLRGSAEHLYIDVPQVIPGIPV